MYWLLAGLLLLIGFRAQAQQPAPGWDTVVPLGLRTGDDGIYVSQTVPDGQGNLYVAGYFFGRITIGSTTLASTLSPTTGASTGDVFVGKYNLSTGRYIWGLKAGSTGGDNATKLIVSGTNLYVAGTTTAPASSTATITFGTTSYATTAHSCMFVAKLADLGSSAAWRWAKVGTNDYLGNVVGLGLNGTSVYLAGDLSGTMAWDTKRVSSNQTQAFNAGDLLLVKITDAGNAATVAWAQAIGSPTYEMADAFVMSGINLYFAGNYFNTAGFGSISLPNTGTSTSRDAFLLKLTDNGTAAVPVWAQQFGGTGNDLVTALSLTGSTLYLAGAFNSPQLAVGTALTVPNSGNNGLLVARLTDAGRTSSFDWATNVPVTGSISVEQLLQTDNKLFLAGTFTSEKASFGSTTLLNSGSGYNNGDLYLMRLTETTPSGATLAWAGQLGSSSQDFLYSLLLLDKRIGVLAHNREATTVGTTAVPARTSFLALANVDSPPATTTTRQGNNNDWFNPASWDNGVPTRNTDVVVPSGMVAFIASGNAQARSLRVEAGANVLQLNGTLELTGNLVSQGSPNTGTYLNELLLTGAGNQTIDNGQSLNLAKLTVGPAGATLNGPVTISSLLTLKGNLRTNNQTLRLVTTAAATGANPALVDNAGGVVQGLASVDRVIIGSNQGLGYRHYAPPVTGATVASLTTTAFTPEVSQASVYNASATPGTTVPFPTVYAYDESRLASTTNNLSAFDKGFVVPADLSAPLVPGYGYAVNIAGTEAVRFVGTLNNGDYPVALTRVAGAADAGWALVGNPYPAVLDWNLTTRTGLHNALYVVQSTGQYTGTYGGYVNGVAVNNGSPFVAPGQGFFVRVAEGRTTGSITFTNAARTVAAVPASFQRLAQETRPLIRLALSGAGLTDEVVAYAEAGATPAFDPHFDASKLPNPTALNLSSVSAGESLAIDGRAAFTPATVLALSVGVPAAGTYSLSAALANLPTGLAAYLHDAQTGQTTPLAAGTSYPFKVAASEATALLAGRFTLRFSTATALATAASLATATVTVYPNPAHGNFTVLVPAVASAATVQGELLNTLGQVVRRQAAALPATGATLIVETAGLAPGIYTLRLQAGASTLAKRVVLY